MPAAAPSVTVTEITPATESATADETPANEQAAAVETATEAVQAGIDLAQRAQEEANQQARATAATETNQIASRLDSMDQRITAGFEAINSRLAELEAEDEPETLADSLAESIDGAEVVTVLEPEATEAPAPRQPPGKGRSWLARVLLNK